MSNYIHTCFDIQLGDNCIGKFIFGKGILSDIRLELCASNAVISDPISSNITPRIHLSPFSVTPVSLELVIF